MMQPCPLGLHGISLVEILPADLLPPRIQKYDHVGRQGCIISLVARPGGHLLPLVRLDPSLLEDLVVVVPVAARVHRLALGHKPGKRRCDRPATDFSSGGAMGGWRG